MKTKNLILVAFFAIALTPCLTQAQSYSNAVGLRLGYPLSATYKHFLNEESAVEVFAGVRSWAGYSWVNVGGLYEFHKPINGVENLNWYFGGGASVYFWNYKYDYLENNSSLSVGVMGTLGLDYKFEELPINVSADWVPVFFVNGYNNGFAGGYGAVSVRYVLN